MATFQILAKSMMNVKHKKIFNQSSLAAPCMTLMQVSIDCYQSIGSND